MPRIERAQESRRNRSALRAIVLCCTVFFCVSAQAAFGSIDIAEHTPAAQEIDTLREAMLAAYEYATIQHEIARAELDANAATDAESIEHERRFVRRCIWALVGIYVLSIIALATHFRNSKDTDLKPRLPLWLGVGNLFVVFLAVYLGMNTLQTARISDNARRLERHVEIAVRALEQTRDGSLYECPPIFLIGSPGVSSSTWLDLVAAGGAYRDARTAYHAAQGVTLKPYDHGPPDAQPKY